ncbi:MAG: hypothetical protein QM714_02730 [Nocardioides sp.]|uniref:VG15 protein n=1 Tax=Nocardioides sp. TaxID=35761 RepID=UPI0039E6A0E5
MAVSDNPTVQRYYRSNLALSAAVERALAQAGTRAAVEAILRAYAEAAIADAHDYYLAMRLDAGVRGRFRMPVETPNREQWDASLDWAMQQPETALLGVGQRLVANAGRGQILAGIRADAKARRWARVTSATGCAFCRMLATRGAVYRSEESADFRAHDHCGCTIEPLFGGRYEPPAHVRADQQLWAESTDGLSGGDALNAFRRAVGA